MDKHNHDHATITHSMNCPVDGCDFNIEVHAHDDDEAVTAIMQAGKEHFGKVHPDAPGMSPEEMEKATREHMQKHDH